LLKLIEQERKNYKPKAILMKNTKNLYHLSPNNSEGIITSPTGAVIMDTNQES
jgi:exonuclease VII large subunit